MIETVHSNRITQHFEKLLTFDEPTHIYTLNGKKCVSVTTILKDFTAQFDALATANRMVAKNPKLTVAGLLAEWDKKRDDASFRGTGIHRYIECIFLGIQYDHLYVLDPYEKLAIDDFIKAFMASNLEPYATEVRVGLEDALLCGTLDFIAKVKGQDVFAIVDWKSNQKNLKSSQFAKPMKYPLNHMDDSKISQFELQTSIYDVMLEETFGWWNCRQKTIFHINGNMTKINLQCRKNEARKIIQLRKESLWKA